MFNNNSTKWLSKNDSEKCYILMFRAHKGITTKSWWLPMKPNRDWYCDGLQRRPKWSSKADKIVCHPSHQPNSGFMSLSRVQVLFRTLALESIDLSQSSWQIQLKMKRLRKLPNRKSQIPRYLTVQIQMEFWHDVNFYRSIWVFRYSGFRMCSISSGTCHVTIMTLRTMTATHLITVTSLLQGGVES